MKTIGSVLAALLLVVGCAGSEPAGPPELTPLTGSLAGVWTCALTAGSQTAVAPTDFRWEGAGRYGWFETDDRIGTWEAVTDTRLNIVELVGYNIVTGSMTITASRMTGALGFQGTTATLGVDCTR